uniref:ManR n=1 Tax=Caldanaerobius polysaccharolyticus TaxID=44256 RepID=L0E134_9THEO|nr:ManR [Caldanaerobius polysaccharolyticus]
MGRVRLEDIAAVVGVSKNTVSKALRGAGGVSAEMREKIRETALKMGYRRVRDLDKEVENITVLCRESFFGEPTFWSSILYGIENSARNRNIKLSVTAVDAEDEENLNIPYAINKETTNGIIIVGTLNDGFIKKIKALGIPIVVIDHYSEEIQCDYINSANKKGIYEALKYLYKSGHRKIGFIGNNEWAYSFRERYESFIYYAKKFNIEVDEDYIWLDISLKRTDFIEDTDYFKRKIKYSEKFPSAWICSNDKIALAFIKSLMDLGISVPDKVSVIGFDDIEIARISHPRLTTLNVPKQAMGERAVSQLLFRISNEDKPYEYIELNTSLIVRDSTKGVF